MAIYKTEHFNITRKIIANMTTMSWKEIPHAAVGYEADVTDLLKELKKINEGVTDKSKKVSINTVMLKILCEGMKAAPKMNTTIKFKGSLVRGTLYYHDNIDISMPMVLKSGEMMTVNMHDMGNKSLTEMAEAINDTIRRANNSNMEEVMYQVSMSDTLKGLKHGKLIQALGRLYGARMPGKHQVNVLSGRAKKEYYSIPSKDRLSKHDIEQGTTTISNIGSIGREYNSTCYLLDIIPPQTTAFCIGAIQKKPWVITDDNGKEKAEIRSTITITCAIDHRALDYGDCVPMLKRLNEIFKNPSIIQSWK